MCLPDNFGFLFCCWQNVAELRNLYRSWKQQHNITYGASEVGQQCRDLQYRLMWKRMLDTAEGHLALLLLNCWPSQSLLSVVRCRMLSALRCSNTPCQRLLQRTKTAPKLTGEGLTSLPPRPSTSSSLATCAGTPGARKAQWLQRRRLMSLPAHSQGLTFP